ncbi:MAG: SurA N-terminal domain-containing protein [Gammaproteobacteria bacterium]
MLQNIRDKVTGWAAGVIFTLLIIPFALWGVNSYFEGGGEVVAIYVNGEDISLRDYQQTQQLVRQRWRENTEEPVTEEVESILKEQAIEQLIRTVLFNQYSDKVQMFVSDSDVASTLRQLPAFSDEDGFNINLLRAYTATRGLSTSEFMQQMREDLLAEQLRGAFYDSGFVTESEALFLAGIKNEKRDIEYVVLSSDELKASLDISDEEVAGYYEENETLFMEPEKVKLEYLVLSAGKLADDIIVEEDEVQAWFEENRQNYEVAGQRHIRQVLVKLPEGAADETVAAMQDKAQELYGLIQAGQSLEQVATGNAEQGEDENVEFSEFEFLTEGILEAGVDEVLFAMEDGEISEPIETKYGFHIIELVEIKGGVSVTLEDIRDQVVTDMKLTQAEELLYDKSDRLATLTYEHPETLDVAAEELGVEILQSDYISRAEPGAGVVAEPEALNAAFSESVLELGENSELLELANGRLMVLRVSDRVEAALQSLDSVQEQIVTRIKFERASDLTKEKGEAIIAALDEGSVAADVAGEYDIDWQSATGILREDETVNRAVLRLAFNSGRPTGDKPLVSGTSLGSGDYAIVIINQVQQASLDEIKKADIKAMREQLLSIRAATDWQDITGELRRNADVEIYEEVF